MQKLEEQTARNAVVRAMGKMFIVPPQGNRLTPEVIDFELIRRNDYDDKLVYRTRLSDGVLLGHFIGDGTGEVAP